MGILVVINAPYSFAAIWTAVRPWLSKETQDKVHIVGSDYKSFLLQYIDEDNLPEEFGGKCTCAEEGGCQFASNGPWMEERKERRQKWLRGEVARPGLFLGDRITKSRSGSEKLSDAVSDAVPILKHSPVIGSVNEL